MLTEEEKVLQILTSLGDEYPEVKGTLLNYSNPLELLIATILSAQCTDERVNRVTKILFSKFKTAEEYIQADIQELQEIIRPTGFYRNKAKFIKAAIKKLVTDFNNEMPHSIDEMIKLPGVARKTANIILSNAFKINQGIAVDTHVMRLTIRLNLTQEKNRDKIEKDLMRIVPQTQWFALTNLFIIHGRRVCMSKIPKCKECIINHLCPSAFIFR